MVLGIDIGGNQIRAGMVDPEGAILASRTIPTPADLDTFLPSLQDAIRWLVENTELPSGVGVGCKGMIDPDTTPEGSSVLSTSQRMASCNDGKNVSRSPGVGMVRDARIAPSWSTIPARI